MNNVLPHFKRPLKSNNEPKTIVSYWDKAMDAYDAKNYKTALLETLNYMNPELLDNRDTNSDLNIVQGQGSAEIRIHISSDTFSIQAPFLKVTESANKVALFRKIAEVNFAPLTLAQIHLKEDTLWFGVEMPISQCQPYKVYDALREVCVYADDYDDEFVEKYKADFYQEPKISPLTLDEKETVWHQINGILTDYKNYSQFFKEKRWDAFQWDIIFISILKIVNMPYVHGTLRTKLQEYVNNMYNGSIDFNHRIDKGTNFMQKLCAMSQKEIMSDVYHAQAVISLKWRSSIKIVQDEAKKMERFVNKYVNDSDNFSLCYYLQYSFLHLLYNFNVEDVHKEAIYDVLEKVSGLEPSTASKHLLNTYYGFLDGNTKVASAAKGSSKGFFSKLFG